MLESVCSAFGICLNYLLVSCFCEMSSTDLIHSLSSSYVLQAMFICLEHNAMIFYLFQLVKPLTI